MREQGTQNCVRCCSRSSGRRSRATCAGICVALILSFAASSLAGTWTITSTIISGSASGTLGPPGVGSNWINGTSIPNGGTVYLPANDSGIDVLESHILGPGDQSAFAYAQTAGIVVRYILTWVPANKRDPAPPTVSFIVTLMNWQAVRGNTGSVPATVAATSKITGDGIVFPDLFATATGTLASFSEDSRPPNVYWWDTKKIHMLAVTNGQAILDVGLHAETRADYSLASNSVLTPTVEVLADAYLVPNGSVAGLILIVPDPKSFPELNLPTDSTNKYAFSATSYPSPGVLGNPAWQSQAIGIAASTLLPYTTYTSFDITGSTRTNDTISVYQDLIRQQFTYTGMPQQNNSFGTKCVEVDCTYLLTSQHAEVQAFFDKSSDNHPDPELPKAPGVTSRTPNWYYYWEQTGARYGTHRYGGSVPGQSGLTHWENGQWVSDIYDGACEHAGNLACWGGAEGIDFYANVCRHEAKHLTNFNAWWTNGWISSLDLDLDSIPDSIEHNLTPAAHLAQQPNQFYGWNGTGTVSDDMNYGPGPSGLVNDDEDYTMHTETPWTNGSADKVDWSHPGHQWR